VELIKFWLIDHLGEFDRACPSFLPGENRKNERGSITQASTAP
jgi:hypothetical protein